MKDIVHLGFQEKLDLVGVGKDLLRDQVWFNVFLVEFEARQMSLNVF